MAKVLRYMPELKNDEQVHVASLMTSMNDEQAEHFAHVYRERRRDPMLTLIGGLAGFVFVAGIQRFYLDQVVMGILHLLTLGFCFVGTIIDVVNYRGLTQSFNRREARDVAAMVKEAFPAS